MTEILIHTGQHYDANMSDVFFRDLDMAPPRVNLGVGSGSHGRQTGHMLEAIESVLLRDRPEMLIIYGDTNSTLAAALAAVKLHIPVAHVEAGLRSFDMRVPEEVNRVLTDHVSDVLFAPTEAAVANLMREGIRDSRICLSGDVMYDAALHYGATADKESRILIDLRLERREFVLVTIHRSENTDDEERLEAIFSGLLQISGDVPMVLPLHPRTKSALSRKGMLGSVSEAIRVIPPVGYLDMMMIEKNARLIVTDSGGVQKEAFFYKVPCVTLRDQTEWRELVHLGWNRVTPPTSASGVAESIRDALTWTPLPAGNPFGDGHSAERIASVIQRSAVTGDSPALISAAT